MTEKPADALPSGYRLHEYRIYEVLGHGSFGITYIARDTSLRTDVAIKEYLPVELSVRQPDGCTVFPRSGDHQKGYEWGLERFLNEAQTLARFKHPNIVPVYRFFEANGTAYMVMAYQQGQSLGELLDRAGPFDEDTLSTILYPLLDGLEEVHKAGILHRDIKPGNIFIRTDGTPVLLDFGSARQASAQGRGGATAVVTPGFAPIEQYTTRGNQGPWTDIYGLGAVSYLALTGIAPADAPDRVIEDQMVPAAEAGQDRADPVFLDAIDAALEMDRKDRPQSVADWRRMFGGDVRVARAGVSSDDKPNRRWIGWAAAAVVLMAMTAGGIGAFSGLQTRDQTVVELAEAKAKMEAERRELERRTDEVEAARRRAEEAAAKSREAGKAAEAERKAAEKARAEAEEKAAEAKRAEIEAKKKAKEETEARVRAEAEAEEARLEKDEAAKKAEEEAEARRAAEEKARIAEEKARSSTSTSGEAGSTGQVAVLPPSGSGPTTLPTVGTKPWLGVRVENVTPRMAFVLGLGKPRGAMVTAIAPRGPAAAAGLSPGDVILAIGGRRVRSADSIGKVLEPLIVGEPVRVDVWRGERVQRLSLKLGGRPASEAARFAASGTEFRLGRTDVSRFPVLGIVAAPMTSNLRDQWGIGSTVHGPVIMKVDPGGSAARMGIRMGDAILSADQVTVRGPADLAKHLKIAQDSGRGLVVLRIYRHGRDRIFALPLR